ncbi:MAG TPA: hypothetical protein VN903_11390 [Polyangia bacterium]|nr:hypothetical protein [Polyangia bacterium]
MPGRTDDATHYTLAEAPVTRHGWTTAVCGARVNEFNEEVDLHAPTCAQCQAWLAERNAPRIAKGGRLVQ